MLRANPCPRLTFAIADTKVKEVYLNQPRKRRKLKRIYLLAATYVGLLYSLQAL